MAEPSTAQATIAGAVHKVQLGLLDGSAAGSDHLLLSAGELLSCADYGDVVEERSIAGLCGYPVCLRRLPSDRRRRGRYRIALREHRVYDLEETYKYCSEECLIASRAFAGTLPGERPFDLRPSKVEQVLGLFGFGESKKGGEVDLGNKGELGLSNLTIKEKDEAGKGEVLLEEWIGPSNAVEGYVPQHDRIQGPKLKSSRKPKKRGDNVKSGEVGNVLLAEKKNVTSTKTLSKPSKNKSSKSREMVFTSSIVIGDGANSVPTSSVTAQDVSEPITKQLEDLLLEKKTASERTPSKSSKHKSAKKASRDVIDEVHFWGTTNIEDVGDEASPCSVTTRNVSEAISECLDNVLFAEKRSRAAKTPPRSSKPKTEVNVNEYDNCQVDFTSAITNGDPAPETFVVSSSVSIQNQSEQLNSRSTVLAGDQASKTSAVSRQNHSKQFCKESEDGLRLEDGTESLGSAPKESNDTFHSETTKDTILKSCLKTLGSKDKNRSVRWADERTNEIAEEIENGIEGAELPQELHEEDADSSLRLASAGACAAALAEAAEDVASGKSEAGDAASQAGFVILPQPQFGHEGDQDSDEDTFEFDRGFVKWPKKTVLLETDMFEVEDSWHDTPPEGFSLTLSSFATMWMALFGWITCSSLAYIYGHDESSLDDFLVVNGREYPHKIVLKDGHSAEIRLAIDGFVCRALPGLVMDLRLPTPVSTLEKFLGHLLDTMSFVDALPSLRLRQWQVVVLLFLDALSVHRLPILSRYVTERNMLQHKVLTTAQVSGEEYETMRDLVLPLGRLPEFSMQSGG